MPISVSSHVRSAVPRTDIARRSADVVTIQILRAFAAWLVVFSHFMQIFFSFEPTNPVGDFFTVHGRIGVDIFFVISGFVMYRSVRSGRYTAGQFMRNRILRIVPAYWIATLCLIAAVETGLVDRAIDYARWTTESLVLSLFFVPHDHLSGIGTYPVLTVGWTLIFEMFFYLSLAVCMAAFGRFALVAAGALMVALPLVSGPDWPLAWIVTNPMLLEFVAGMALSWVYDTIPRGVWKRSLAPILGLGMLAAIVPYTMLIGTGFRYVAATLLVAAALLWEDRIQQQVGLLTKTLRYLGDRSYSAYLYHPVVLMSLFSAFGRPETALATLAVLAGVVVLTLIMSELSYKLVEIRLSKALRQVWR